MYILDFDSTREDKLKAMEHYKEGGEIGVWLPLPYHTDLEVLVTNKMGYYNPLGRFIPLRKPDYFHMMRAYLSVVNYRGFNHSTQIKMGNFLDNIELDLKFDTLPYVNNMWIPGSFGLIPLRENIYADPETFEYVRATDGKRQSIFDGVFKSAQYRNHFTISVLEWFRTVNPDSIILGDKVVALGEYLKELYNDRTIKYYIEGFYVYTTNGERLRITRAGRFRTEEKLLA